MKEVCLNHNQKAIVDDEDYLRVLQHIWSANWSSKTYHAYTGIIYNGKRRSYGMHSLIAGLPVDSVLVVDHINGNGLDNRKCNLRICTRSENAKNRHNQQSYRGPVKKKTQGDKWDRISIRQGGIKGYAI